LYQWRINPGSADDIIGQFRRAQDFGNVDVEWFDALVRGVIASSGELETGLAGFLDREFKSLDLIEQTILQMGAWELLNQPDLPHPVILNEAVDLARRFGAEEGHSFINAVLDRAAKQWRLGQAAEASPETNGE
jgi:N utilization substance protein B